MTDNAKAALIAAFFTAAFILLLALLIGILALVYKVGGALGYIVFVAAALFIVLYVAARSDLRDQKRDAQ